jgi:hypothetical protein
MRQLAQESEPKACHFAERSCGEGKRGQGITEAKEERRIFV